MGILTKQGPPKFELFNRLSWTHKIFKITKHKGKINFDKVWEYQNGRSSSNKATKILSFLTFGATWNKVLE